MGQRYKGLLFGNCQEAVKVTEGMNDGGPPRKRGRHLTQASPLGTKCRRRCCSDNAGSDSIRRGGAVIDPRGHFVDPFKGCIEILNG